MFWIYHVILKNGFKRCLKDCLALYVEAAYDKSPPYLV